MTTPTPPESREREHREDGHWWRCLPVLDCYEAASSPDLSGLRDRLLEILNNSGAYDSMEDIADAILRFDHSATDDGLDRPDATKLGAAQEPGGGE